MHIFMNPFAQHFSFLFFTGRFNQKQNHVPTPYPACSLSLTPPSDVAHSALYLPSTLVITHNLRIIFATEERLNQNSGKLCAFTYADPHPSRSAPLQWR